MSAPIFVTPLTTEKAYAMSLKNVYVFEVPLTANKQEIVDAVSTQFKVTVTGVKTAVQNGKSVRFSRGKNRYPGTAHRTDSKKAYVTLAEGSKLNIFEQPADQDTPKKSKDAGGDK